MFTGQLHAFLLKWNAATEAKSKGEGEYTHMNKEANSLKEGGIL